MDNTMDYLKQEFQDQNISGSTLHLQKGKQEVLIFNNHQKVKYADNKIITNDSVESDFLTTLVNEMLNA